jgi:hypothetical protein
MAAPPRSFPIPRGQLSLNLAEYFANQVATAATSVTGAGGGYAQVGVFNNSVVGSLLHVVGCNVWNLDVNGGVTMRIIQGSPPGAAITPGVPLNPMIATLDGQLLSTPNGAKVGGQAIWRLSGNNYPDSWVYDAPMAILPAGWALYTDPDDPNTTLQAAFRWIVIKI